MPLKDPVSLGRKRIGIPKGMLLHITLNILEKKSMSGSELMDEVEYYTDWRPSPGSIYPLLSKLGGEGLIVLSKSEDPSLKRYDLTMKGTKAVNEHHSFEPYITARHNTMQRIYWKLIKRMDVEVFEAYFGLLQMLEKVTPTLDRNSEAIRRVKNVLNEASRKIEEHEERS